MDQITEKLWISDAPTLRDISEPYRFEYVLTLGYFDRLGYNRPVVSDTADRFVFQDSQEHDYQTFADAVDHLLQVLKTPRQCPVVVHCQAGVSRSPAVCTAALAVREESSYETAFEKVKTVRPKADPIAALESSARKYIANNQ